ncbi:hypothetical protein X743_27240 [Mesorhizobium sp. LNHC252B00]|nr:hypothetical protein X743_27240 [Mesorhizobium sp. LNHC252B00]
MAVFSTCYSCRSFEGNDNSPPAFADISKCSGRIDYAGLPKTIGKPRFDAISTTSSSIA